jgi:hypothetical protein
MRTQCMVVVLGCLMLSGMSSGQTAQPANEDRLDYRAARAFDRGDYGTALPLLRRLSDELADKPAKQAVVQDRIRVCIQALAAAATTQEAVPARVTHAAPVPGKTLDLAIKELGNFDYDAEKGGKIPDDVKRLSGSKVRLRGFMMPIDQLDKITKFALVPSLFGCCYGAPPQIQHVIIVTCPSGTQADLTSDEVIVEGTLNVQERKDDGYVVSLFDLAAASLKAAPIGR